MGQELNLNFDLYGQQEDFVYSKYRNIGFVSGIGAGKTTAGSIRSLLHGINTEGMGMVVGPTFTMLRDSTLRTFRRICGDAISSFNATEMRATFANGNEVIFRSADNPERLRGPNIAWLWIDEAQLVDEEAYYICIGRLREGMEKFWATFTPNGKLHWTYRILAKEDEFHKLYRARTRDNVFLSDSYLRSLEAAYTGQRREQELEGVFVDPEGTLFKRDWFNRISPDQLPEGLQWTRCWDLALTEEDAGDTKKGKKPDRTASVSISVDQFGNIYIRDGIAFRKEWPEARQVIMQSARMERTPIVIEAVAFQKAAVQELLREPELMSIDIRGYRPGEETDGYVPQTDKMYADRNAKKDKDKSKVDRARVWQARAANNQIYLVEGKWSVKPDKEHPPMIEDFLDEVCDFRADMSHQHDDWVDAVSIGMKHLRAPTTFENLRNSAKPTGLMMNQAFGDNGSSQVNAKRIGDILFVGK